ncbi:MAG: septal ring lytic transglycosylase RlpA family protein [Pseudomonadota bacterium]|jgi:rare lipoprotein A
MRIGTLVGLSAAILSLGLAGCTELSIGSHILKKTGEKQNCVAEGAPKIGNPYLINGERYVPQNSSWGFTEEGVASWYGEDFHGKATANGECYNMYNFTAAHRTLPLPTVVRVTNMETNKSVVVKVNDRGPFARGRVIDLSYAAAQSIGMVGKGTAPVRIEALSGAFHGDEATQRRRVMALKGRDQIAQTLPTQVPSAQDEENLPPLNPGQPLIKMAENQVPAEAQNIPKPPAYEKRVFADATPLKNTLAYVQIGAFADANSAAGEQMKLSAVYKTAHISVIEVNGATLSRVRVGPFRSLADADAALAKVVEAGWNAAQIKVERR